MLLLLSPAKKLDYDTPVRTQLHSQPVFVSQAETLIHLLRQKKASEIAHLMKLSPALADLNLQRYAQWEPTFTARDSRQAILAFNGDVYEGLQADSLSDDALTWAQQHLLMLSGLYGVLRPLDWMRPYRLEMGTRLENPAGSNLYHYWGGQIARYINSHLAHDPQPWVLNLASEEYFKAVDLKTLSFPVVQCVFQDEKNGAWKVISFYAKKARGLMARYVIDERLQSVEQLHEFNRGGYRYVPELSSPDKLVFRRPEHMATVSKVE